MNFQFDVKDQIEEHMLWLWTYIGDKDTSNKVFYSRKATFLKVRYPLTCKFEAGSNQNIELT